MTEIIPHWLDKQADLSPNSKAIEYPEKDAITFQQLQEKSRRYAKRLLSLGIKAGDHVALLSNNNTEMIKAIHALSYIGAVAVLLNTRLSEYEIAYQLKDGDVSFLLTQSALFSSAEEAAASIRNLSVYAFHEVDQTNTSDAELHTEINLDDPFTIIYTSGTTGFPKGVTHTYGNHWWSAVSSALNLGLSDKDKWLAALPLFHVSGLSILIKSVVYGIPVYLLEKFDVETVHQAITTRGVTMVSVVAVMLDKLITRLQGKSYPDAFRCMLLGGGPAPKPLLENAKNHGIPVYQTYGMTETSSQIVTLSPNYALEKLGSAGKPLFPAQLKIINNEEKVEPNTVGEITVTGPMVTNGYYNNQEANQKSFSGNWLATGDLGYLDEDGFLFVMDRRKDLIISGGENVYPAEVESVLAGMPLVKECAVVGKADTAWGQIPVAFIVKKEKRLSEDDVLGFCYGKLAKYKSPKQVIFIDELPRNASNKVLRRALTERLDKGEFSHEH